MTRIGREAFVREVIEANGLLAGEVSTHLLFKEYGTIEMPLAGLYYLLKALENYTDATRMVAEFNGYARGQVIQFITDKKDEAIEALKQKYSNYQQITIDGIRIESPDWWFCVRKSGTEPMLKVAIEGKNREIYDSLLAELRLFFAEHSAVEKL
jgi:phosphomannomutase/phosphoglucomutase